MCCQSVDIKYINRYLKYEIWHGIVSWQAGTGDAAGLGHTGSWPWQGGLRAAWHPTHSITRNSVLALHCHLCATAI